MDLYFEDFYQQLPNACVDDITPPTFGGIVSTTPNIDGSITATWIAATDATPPIEYLIYIAVGSVSAASLFVPSNLQTISPAGTITRKIFMLADQLTYLVNGQSYTLGVRAKDAVGNIDSNMVTSNVTAIASGNLPAFFQNIVTDLTNVEIDLSNDHADFQADHANFQADHANFQADHADFQADHADFQADHADFQADHADFQADHANFVADDAAFDADHANFVADDAAYDANNAALAAEIADLAALSNSLVSALAPTKLSVKIKPQQKLNISIKEGS